ncbi:MULTISPECIES: metal-dependent hydrolase [Pseudomonas]|uniref:Metal-dependent hydrolase n=2 Tax=Pseudomonas TaxID=286 RepID=A0A7Y7WN36_9PSED|nr:MULTISPECIES: metal-dependent hydrolase [Pseudomonas]MPQ68231.1 metal-dependent hydrolase [Pseudomonas sp. MWU12-2323]NWB84100.1 metal-dependent hydrolase [Pseudomonas gingeri]
MLPVRRDVRVDLPAERAKDWHAQGPWVTHFFNALSLLFPSGELFFMDSVRHYRDRVHDPELKRQIQGFIGQEAMHSREHLRYNDMLQAAGLPAHKLDRRLRIILDFQKKHFPPAFNLGITIALEHYTAMLADLMLRDPSRFGDSVEGYRQMWMWHALEETEHKSVAFDVWNAALKPGPGRYLIRVGSMLSTTLMFWLVVFDFHVRLLIADRKAGHPLKGCWSMLKYLFGRHGVFPRIALPWLDYFKPGFHPWDHDNREHLQRIDALVEAMDKQRP